MKATVSVSAGLGIHVVAAAFGIQILLGKALRISREIRSIANCAEVCIMVRREVVS